MTSRLISRFSRSNQISIGTPLISVKIILAHCRRQCLRYTWQTAIEIWIRSRRRSIMCRAKNADAICRVLLVNIGCIARKIRDWNWKVIISKPVIVRRILSEYDDPLNCNLWPSSRCSLTNSDAAPSRSLRLHDPIGIRSIMRVVRHRVNKYLKSSKNFDKIYH